ANIVADEANAGGAGLIDEWFEAWREPDVSVRERSLARISVAEVQFRDRFSFTDGLADLLPHIAAAQRFMPGLRMERRGD
ncbi:hypothetical protein NF717_12165, partial [Lactococcus formosensis]